MMCGVEESTKQWSCIGRGSAYMSCRIGYMYMQQGKCRLVDVELQIHSHVEEVINICIYMPQGKCLLVDAHTRGSKESLYNTL